MLLYTIVSRLRRGISKLGKNVTGALMNEARGQVITLLIHVMHVPDMLAEAPHQS